MTAAIDSVIEFFEREILALTPTTDPGKPFHLLGDGSGLLREQPKNSGFHRLMDIRYGWDPETGDTHMPLTRHASVAIMIGYLGSIKTRRIDRIMRQDEELIARHLLQSATSHEANRPFQWHIRPPHMLEELDEAGSATMLVIVYEVHYTCDSV